MTMTFGVRVFLSILLVFVVLANGFPNKNYGAKSLKRIIRSADEFYGSSLDGSDEDDDDSYAAERFGNYKPRSHNFNNNFPVNNFYQEPRPFHHHFGFGHRPQFPQQHPHGFNPGGGYGRPGHYPGHGPWQGHWFFNGFGGHPAKPYNHGNHFNGYFPGGDETNEINKGDNDNFVPNKPFTTKPPPVTPTKAPTTTTTTLFPQIDIRSADNA